MALSVGLDFIQVFFNEEQQMNNNNLG